MAQPAPLIEVDPEQLSQKEWTKVLWAVFWRGSRYTLPPLLALIVTLAVFGTVIGIIALEVGLSLEVFERYEFVFEIVGDVLTGLFGMYVFARNLRSLPHVQLGRYRFALVRSDAPPAETRSA